MLPGQAQVFLAVKRNTLYSLIFVFEQVIKSFSFQCMDFLFCQNLCSLFFSGYFLTHFFDSETCRANTSLGCPKCNIIIGIDISKVNEFHGFIRAFFRINDIWFCKINSTWQIHPCGSFASTVMRFNLIYALNKLFNCLFLILSFSLYPVSTPFFFCYIKTSHHSYYPVGAENCYTQKRSFAYSNLTSICNENVVLNRNGIICSFISFWPTAYAIQFLVSLPFIFLNGSFSRLSFLTQVHFINLT